MLPRVAVLKPDPVSLLQERKADSARTTETKTDAVVRLNLQQKEKQQSLETYLRLLGLRQWTAPDRGCSP